MRNLKGIILVFIFTAAINCNLLAQSSNIDKSDTSNILCDRVSEIKHLPFKDGDETEIDKTYKSLYDAGETVIPCLINKVTDTTPMKDPRNIPGPTDTRVGDVAYFVLVGISKLNFIELLPAQVQKEYETEGVYAYHQFVSNRKNRVKLQADLKKWYERNYGASN